MDKTIHIEGIGEVVLKRNKRFRRLSLRMAPTKGVWVNIPISMNYSHAQKLIDQNMEWIKENLSKIRLKESKQTIFCSKKTFSTRYHQLQIVESNKDMLSATLNTGVLTIHRPTTVSQESDQVQLFIRKAVIETLRREAKYYLPSRVEQLALKHQFEFQSVKIRNAKTRWGSCSYDNNINLNLHLMRLPQELIDYVILHELCHTQQKNHSSSFWDLMKKVCPQVESLRKDLRAYSLTVF